MVTVLPLTALILGIVVVSQSLHHDAMRSLVGDRDLKAVQAAASSLEQEIDHRAAMISILARSLPQQQNPAACLSGLSGSGPGANLGTLPVTPDEISSSFDAGLALFSSGGCLAAATPGSENAWPGSFATKAPGFLASVVAAEGDRPVFSQPLAANAGSPPVMLVGVRLTGGQALVGAFTPVALFQGITNTLISSGTTTVLIVSRVSPDAAFNVIYRAGPEKPDEQNASHPGIKEALNGQSGISYFQSGQGEHVVAYSPITPTGWGLVIEEAWEDIENPDLRASQYAPLLMAPVILLALAALWLGARRIVQPLQALEDRASALARGDFSAIHHPVGGIGEIRDLQE